MQPTYECNVALSLKKTGIGNYDGVVVVGDSRTRGNLPPKSVDQFQELLSTGAVTFTNGKDKDKVSSMYAATLKRTFGGALDLSFSRRDWTDAEMSTLAPSLMLEVRTSVSRPLRDNDCDRWRERSSES